MQWSDVPLDPPPRMLRQFAGLWLLFFGGLACWQGFAQANTGRALVLTTLAATVGVIGLAWPRAVRWLFVGWMVAAFPIGWAVSQLVVALLFFGLFTPVALVFRLLGRDALDRRYLPAAATYWAPRPEASAASYFRQF